MNKHPWLWGYASFEQKPNGEWGYRVGWEVKMEYRPLQPLHKINVMVVDDG